MQGFLACRDRRYRIVDKAKPKAQVERHAVVLGAELGVWAKMWPMADADAGLIPTACTCGQKT